MTLKTTHKAAIATGSAGVIACCVAFTPIWEGFAPVAQPDAIGTGHPMTYCYGQTDEFGKVKAGTRFTKQECDEKLKESIEKTYYPEVHACVQVPLPVKSEAALVDAAYNAGSARVCHSPMLAKMNAGQLEVGCNAFDGWIITSNHQVRPGLIARRGGRKGDPRKSEKQLCLEGVAEGIAPPPPAPQPAPQPSLWSRIVSFFHKLFGGI